MSKDILDQILLSPKAFEEWHRRCDAFTRRVHIPDPQLIPDEQAILLEDGERVMLFVEVAGYGRCELVLGKEDWGWFS